MTDYKQTAKEVQANNRNIFASTGDTGKAFMALHAASVKPGALDTKTKELISLGIAIADHCEGCITQHMKSLIKAGVTREEVVETINVAILMGGGPSTVYGGKALECYDQYTAE